MTPAEHQEIMDIAEVQVNRYFDHYLSEVFPAQLDRMFASHNESTEAHPKAFKAVAEVTKKVNRLFWMGAGIAFLVTAAGAVGSVVYYWYQAIPRP
jgi:GMP synthase-like glutamine amidotransferase